ncbi:retrovirus-related Pol polyprotein from transposon opus [Trichonephila clavipes]|nr:retrovirus-related Pol polyprotein from transposon opus [Trichonephila clavipes]
MYRNPVTSQYILDFKKCPIEVYLQVDDHVHPGNCPAAISSEKKDLLHMEFYYHLPSWAMNEQMPYFSSVSDEWSRDLKSVPSTETAFMSRKAKRNSDETSSQFASRLTSMWLYYCKLREANDFESVNQLIVADKMFEMLDSETATHIGVLQGEEWYKPRDLGKRCDIFYASKGKSYDEPERAKWNDCEKRSFNGSWGKQPFGEKKSDNFSSRKNLDKEGTELVDGTVAARVDVLGKVIPRRAIEDKLSKLVKTSISVDGKLVHALLDSGTEITVIKKDLGPGISVEGASTIYLKSIFGPAVKCPLVYVPIGLATGGQVNVVHQQVLCAFGRSFGRRRVASTRCFGYVGRSPE